MKHAIVKEKMQPQIFKNLKIKENKLKMQPVISHAFREVETSVGPYHI
jgi:hypothetical protein